MIMNKERNDHDRSWISLMTFEDWFPKMRSHTYGLHKRIVEWEAELLFDEKGEWKNVLFYGKQYGNDWFPCHGDIGNCLKVPVAQWLEPAAHNGLVGGSSPSGDTKKRIVREDLNHA